MSSTATFTIDTVKVLTNATIPGVELSEPTGIACLRVTSGELAQIIPIHTDNISEEKVQKVAEALQGQQITGTIRRGEEPQTGPDGEAYYMDAFSDAVHKAIGEKIGEQT